MNAHAHCELTISTDLGMARWIMETILRGLNITLVLILNLYTVCETHIITHNKLYFSSARIDILFSYLILKNSISIEKLMIKMNNILFQLHV